MRTLVLGLPLAFTAGCLGSISDPGAGGDDDDDVVPSTEAFECRGGMQPDTLPLRRLSKAQYLNTVRDLIRGASPADADEVIASVEPLFVGLPDDAREGPGDKYGGFTRLDQTVHQEHIDQTYSLGLAVGAELTDAARIDSVVGACASDDDDGNDDGCLDAFIRDFGERALRRPVSDDDVAFYREVAGDAPFERADYVDVIGLLLTAPQMLYFVEHGSGSGTGKQAVDPWELASRLSYHFWQTLPDDELFESARSGELATDEGYAAQVARIFADPRTRGAVRAFYDEWLLPPDLEELDSRVGTPAFDTLRGDFEPGPELRERMLAEVTDMATYYSLDTAGTFSDFFTSNRSFATTDDLAEVYGVSSWDGEGEPPVFPDADRAGLITRAAVVATGSANTRPIMKGVFIRKALLCDSIPPPPANAAMMRPELSPDLTTREVTEALTEGEGTNCNGCHGLLINPLGFATEDFDALGRFRTEQLLFDESGEVSGTKAIDTATIPQITPADDRPSSGPVDLSRMLVESGKPQACMARHYFRFTFGRTEVDDQDGCALADIHGALEGGLPLEEVLRRVALSPAFKQRTFE